jgi:hypothetical protein
MDCNGNQTRAQLRDFIYIQQVSTSLARAHEVESWTFPSLLRLRSRPLKMTCDWHLVHDRNRALCGGIELRKLDHPLCKTNLPQPFIPLFMLLSTCISV